MVLGESIAGIRVPDSMTEDQLKVLELYSKKVESGIGTTKELEIELSPKQAQAVAHAMNILRPGEVFKIGGQAGTGKSMTLGALVKELVKNNKNHMVIAPSAVAASNLRDSKGLTIHSAAGFEPGAVVADGFVTTIEDIDENGNTVKIQVSSRQEFIKKYVNTRKSRELAKLDYLIIDEISMVDAHLMDLLNLALQTSKKNFDLPFGGVKLVLFGDDYQLPPVEGMSEEAYQKKLDAFAEQLAEGSMSEEEFVAKKEELYNQRKKAQYMELTYRSYRWFNANIFSRTPIAFTELTEVFRQKDDKEWADMLARMSRGRQTDEDLAVMKTRVLADEVEDVLNMVLKNDEANRINEFEVNKLKNAGASNSSFKGEFTGNKGSFKNSELTVPENVTYYVGEKVMFIANDNQDLREQVGVKAPPGTRRFDNGTVGTVVGFSENRGLPIVEIVKTVTNPKTGEKEEEKVQVEVGQATQQKKVGKDITRIDPNTGKPITSVEESLSATYSQIPLVPGYAVTIHKTQSKSLDAGSIFLGSDKKPDKPWESGQTYVALSRVRTLDGIRLSRALTHDDFIVDPEIVEFYKEVEDISAQEKVKEDKQKLEREQQKASEQQPSEPASNEPAVDEMRSGVRSESTFKDAKFFTNIISEEDITKAKDIISYKTKAILGMPSDWGTDELFNVFLSNFDYSDEEQLKSDLDAINFKNLQDLNLEQRLLVSLINEHGKADVYTHPESGSTIKRYVSDNPEEMSSDQQVLQTVNSHKFIVDSGHVINNGLMNIELMAYYSGNDTILGSISPSNDIIKIYTKSLKDMIDEANSKNAEDPTLLPISEQMENLHTLAHEYGHYLDYEVKNYYKNRPEDEPSFASYIRSLILSGMQNRAQIAFRKHGLETQSEYIAESYAGWILRDYAKSRGQSEDAIFDAAVIDKLLDAIEERNSRRPGQKPTMAEIQAKTEARKAQKEYEKEMEIMWENIEKDRLKREKKKNVKQ
jgi:hypothetical protein